MAESRIPIKTKEKIIELKKETDIKKALEGVVDLFENYVRFEEKFPVKYDSQTGRPIEYEWKSSKQGKFNSEIYLGGFNLTAPPSDEPGLAKIVVEHIKKKGPILADTPLGAYVFSYEERDASSGEPGGGIYSATRYLISVRKVNKIG